MSEDNINNNNNKEIIQGKKINFDGEVNNLNLIQNRKNSNFYKTELKEENKSSFFLSPTKANVNENEINYQNAQSTSGQIQNKINMPPNSTNTILNSNKNMNNNKLINNSIQDKNNLNNSRTAKNRSDQYLGKNRIQTASAARKSERTIL